MKRSIRSLLLVVPLVLLGACNRQGAEPPMVTEAPSATFTLETANVEGAKDTYVSFPLSLSSPENAEVYGFDVMVNYGADLELVTLTTSAKGVVTELSDLGGQYAQLSVLSDAPLTRIDLHVVARVIGERDAQVRFSEPEVLLADGTVKTTTELAIASFKLGEGGQATAPKGSTLEARADALLGALPGTATASTLRSYAVPTVMDAAWVEREQGDLNNDGRVNIRDAQILLRALLGKAELDAYQRVSADLLDDQQVDKQDFVALILKKAFARSKHKYAYMSVHPTKLELNGKESDILLVGNGGNTPLDLTIETGVDWLGATLLETDAPTPTLGYQLTLKQGTKAGNSAQVTLTEKNGQTRVVEVVAKSDYPEEESEEEPSASLESVDATFTIDAPVGIAPLAVTFSSIGEAGDSYSYAWSFGDGSRSNGLSAEHSYSKAGNYTATLTVTNAAGEQETSSQAVSVLPNLDEIGNTDSEIASPDWLNLKDTDTLSIDLGEPVPGWEYRWDFGDGSTGEGTKVNHTYDALGMYELNLSIVDTNETVSGQGLRTQAAGDGEELFEKRWLPNVWRPAPKASFDLSSDSGSGVPLGVAPFGVSFDASASRGWGVLTYTWDFGDGSSAEGSQASHTFDEGEHVVTLTVSDKYGQQDQFRAYVVAKNENFYGQMRFDYPIKAQGLGAQSLKLNTFAQLELLETLSQKSSGSNVFSSASAELQAAAVEDKPLYETFYPYVLHNDATLNFAAFRWSPWDLRLGGASVFCEDNRPRFGDEGIQVSYNGANLYEPVVFKGVKDFNVLPDFCVFVNIRNGSKGLGVRDRADNVMDVTASRYDQRYSFDTFSGLRVPKVHLSILPDQMLPGEFASPYITENTAVIDGKEELILTVRIRESEAQGYANFKLPVYAVNGEGDRVNATGYFKAEIAGEISDCGDCVMVDGKAYMNVSVPVRENATFDFTDFKLYMDESCDFDTSNWTDTRYGTVSGCNYVTATHAAPGNVADVEPFPYPLSASDLTEFDTLALGATVEERKAFLENFGDTSVEVVKFGVNFIPFVSDGADLIGQVYNLAVGEDLDPVLITLASAGLVLDATTGGFADVTAPIKAVYKLSLKTDGFIADLAKQSVSELIAGGKSGREVIEEMTTQFSTYGKLFLTGGPAAVKSADQLAKGLTKLCSVGGSALSAQATCSPLDVSSSIKNALTNATNSGISQKDLTDSLLGVCCSPAGGGNGYISGAESLVDILTKVQGPDDIGKIRGAYAAALAGDSLRKSGFASLEYPKANSFKATNRKGQLVDTEPDLLATDRNGVRRIIETKNNGMLDRDQEHLLKDMARQTGRQPSFFSAGGLDKAQKDALRRAGVDVLDASGNVVN